MGLGAYLAAVTERDHYIAEEKRERDEIATKPDAERDEIYEIMMTYGISRDAVTPLISALESNVEEWVRVRTLSLLLYARFDSRAVYDEL